MLRGTGLNSATDGQAQQRQTEIESKMATLERELTSLSHAVETLCSRLSPVLRNEPPQVNKNPVAGGAATPLGNVLCGYIDTLSVANERIITTLDRLEV